MVCDVCMHKCRLDSGQHGICQVRCNENGKNISKNYGIVTSLALDPIEKKPFRCFYPGSYVLSVGSFGCNLKCPFCQNYEISMAGPKDVQGKYISPEEFADLAWKYKAHGNIGAAFTYNEPLVGYEYVRDAAKLVKGYGMKNVLVTNGSFSLWVLEEVLPYMDAMNIDLKGFREEFYTKIGGSLETVKDFIQKASKSCHIELTTLIIPGWNDGKEEMEDEAKWIASLDPSIPLHITRFFPRYHMTDVPATEVEKVYKLASIAGKYLKNVFTGNC